MNYLISSVLLGAGSAAIFGWMLVPREMTVEALSTSLELELRAKLLREKPLYRRVLPVLQSLAHHHKRWMKPRILEWVNERVRRAGNPLALCTLEWIALCELCGVVGFLMGVWGIHGVTHSIQPVAALAIAALAAGYPLLYLSDAGTERIQRINRGLPYAMDLVRLSLEAGLDFNGALERVVARQNPEDPLTCELEVTLHEIRMGRTRRDALLQLRERAKSDYISDLVQALNQGTEMGTPLAEVLRLQSESLRTKRWQRAEKIAAEAPVQLLVPMMFILLAVVLMIFGSLVVRGMRDGFF